MEVCLLFDDHEAYTIIEAIATILFPFTTYNSCEIAAAMRPVPRRAVPVFVMRLGEDGIFSIISSARLEGGTGLVISQ
jgi:hypothetical protein